MQKLTFNSPAFQKRYDQNSRILTDFPWLWAVSPRWAFVYDKLSAGKADDTLKQFLYEKEPDQTVEVWAYVSGLCLQYVVERIEWRDHTPRYADRIKDYYHCPQDLQYVVLLRHVKGGDGIVAFSHKQVHVYRSQSKRELFDTFIRTPPTTVFAQ